jgi:23S rRNA-/tRNA-specific pseudouridylate synthase
MASIVRYDANGLFAVHKPCGVLSHPNGNVAVRSSIVYAPYDIDGRVFLPKVGSSIFPIYLLHRLDSPTQGILLLSIHRPTAQAVRKSFERFAVKKTYHAICKASEGRDGQWIDGAREFCDGKCVRLRKNGHLNMCTDVFYEKEIMIDKLRCIHLRLHPKTGRTHQLRFQCARHGFPIAGDKTYGDFCFNGDFRRKMGDKHLQLLAAKIDLTYELREKEFQFCASSHSISSFLSFPKHL